MRLISQNGNMNVPFDHCAVCLTEKGEHNYEIKVGIAGTNQYQVFGVYSYRNAAWRVMRMINRRSAAGCDFFRLPQDVPEDELEDETGGLVPQVRAAG